MKTSGKINILTGEEAVRCFKQEGAESCSQQGFTCVETVEYDEHTSPEDLAREVLNKANGQLASIVISQEDADIIIGEE